MISATVIDEIRALAQHHSDVAETITKLLQELEETQSSLRGVTNLVLNQRVLRSSCEHSCDGIFRVHLRENDWDRLYAACKDIEKTLL